MKEVVRCEGKENIVVDVLDMQLKYLHSISGVGEEWVTVVIHGTRGDLTISWPFVWVDWGHRDIGGSVSCWVVCSACGKGVGPKRRDDGNDTFDGWGCWLGYFKEDLFVVDEFWVGRGSQDEVVIYLEGSLIRWFGVKFM